NLPARFGTDRSQYGYNFKDSSEGILNFHEIVKHKPSHEIDSIIASKVSDTIQIIGLYKYEYKRRQINQYVSTSSSHSQMQRVNLVIDTLTNTVNYLYFEDYDNSSNGEYSYSSTTRSSYNSTKFTLKNVEYIRY